MCRLARAGKEMDCLSPGERADAVRNWLDDASAEQLYIRHRFAEEQRELKGRTAPVQDWLKVIRSLSG